MAGHVHGIGKGRGGLAAYLVVALLSACTDLKGDAAGGSAGEGGAAGAGTSGSTAGRTGASGAGAGGAGTSGIGGERSAGRGGSGGAPGGAAGRPATKPDGQPCAESDECTSGFCIDRECTTPATCDPESCDGGRMCMGEACACPSGVFMDGSCCGDDIRQGNEACDDGEANSDSEPDACRTDCSAARCGDGVTDDREECDEGAENSDTAADACRSDCVAARCGDSAIDTGERCDDGNTTAGDGCSPTCRSEPVAIDADSGVTCALLADGRLKCWGQSASGQLGVDATAHGNRDSVLGNDPSDMGANLPVVLDSVTQFALDGYSACAVSMQEVYCWGANNDGWIRSSPLVDVAAPIKIDLGGPVKAVAPSGSHACALMQTDEVRCWGANDRGQLATGNEVSVLPSNGAVAAVPINLQGAIAKVVATSARRSCAIAGTDVLKCWGSNSFGALGIGSSASEWGSMPGETTPLPVSLSGVGFTLARVAVGGSHSCAVSTQGKVRCWGDNEYGKLGIGSTMDLNTPSADLELVGQVKQIAAGSATTLALMADGKVRAWGVGEGSYLHGRAGVTSDVGNNPGEIAALPDIDLGTGVVVKQIAAGVGNACALTTDNRLKCWGANSAGELGHGNTIPHGMSAAEMGDNLPFTEVD